MAAGENAYLRIIEAVFVSNYARGKTEIPFERAQISAAAQHMGLPVPKNLGDVIYAVRYRTGMPASILAKAPKGKTWIIRPA